MRFCGLVNAFVLGSALYHGIWWLLALAIFNVICCGYFIVTEEGVDDAH